MPITSKEKQKFTLYTMQFKAQIEKLMVQPALVSNAEAVTLFLTPFAYDLHQGVLNQVKSDLKHAGVDLALRRDEDPFLIKEVLSGVNRYMQTASLD